MGLRQLLRIGQSTKTQKAIYISTGFHTVDLTKQSPQKVVEKYNGKLVLICEDHHSINDTHYFMAKLRFDPSDNECYFARRFIPSFDPSEDAKLGGEARYHYHDLNGIMTPHNIDAFGKFVASSE